MQLNPTNIEDYSFEKGYPKTIYHKHYVPARIYYGPNHTIIGGLPRRLEFYKNVYSSYEEYVIKHQKKIKRSSTQDNLYV